MRSASPPDRLGLARRPLHHHHPPPPANPRQQRHRPSAIVICRAAAAPMSMEATTPMMFFLDRPLSNLAQGGEVEDPIVWNSRLLLLRIRRRAVQLHRSKHWSRSIWASSTRWKDPWEITRTHTNQPSKLPLDCRHLVGLTHDFKGTEPIGIISSATANTTTPM